ncbi:16S rRNA (guanine(966)-N(2))-methyltransferase RsmD [Brumimicrobium salinarum]|uniref:16S rRNA (Guanine(966)-N(2))-methyltransferase RsmD n=1 Tax=Brumimicrobium salinarum TaxID=2058658 RepID=A0A2I0R4V2_9FLAO|nr:RsmD family RNA methyltransferase [Brumimicrobium salinarum]PKR81622.1 16S rRNA (guanine(966)-N(2))-methyltransferase RsmD [Brumimicrobium salinarum]
MRIISGLLKKQRFSPPKGFPSRPTTDFAKEGLFNVLENELYLEHLDILDLFAGTGNISFEFASREAGRITSVDKNFKCTRFIKSFAAEHGIGGAITVVKADVLKFVSKHQQTYDLIFADPPFQHQLHHELIDGIFANNLLKKEGVFILEHGKHDDFSTHKNFTRQKKYGQVVFSFFE